MELTPGPHTPLTEVVALVSVAEAAGRVGVRLLVTPIEGLPAAAEVATVPVAGVRTLAEAIMVVKDPVWRDRVLERGRRWLRGRGAVVAETTADAPDLCRACGHDATIGRDCTSRPRTYTQTFSASDWEV